MKTVGNAARPLTAVDARSHTLSLAVNAGLSGMASLASEETTGLSHVIQGAPVAQLACRESKCAWKHWMGTPLLRAWLKDAIQHAKRAPVKM